MLLGISLLGCRNKNKDLQTNEEPKSKTEQIPEQFTDASKPIFDSNKYDIITPDYYSNNNSYGGRDLFREMMDRRNAGLIAHELRNKEDNAPYFDINTPN